MQHWQWRQDSEVKCMNPKISVALAALNSERTLAAAISSLQAQSCGDWELLLMDDGSSDLTLKIAQSFQDARIRIVADGVHRGLPGQLNRAVKMARGKYLARMDADDIAYPNRFQKQVEFLENNPEIDLTAGWVTVFRSDGTLLGSRRPPALHDQICARPWRGIPMAHPTWMGRIEWFRANPYKEDQVRMEDRELLLRTYRSSRFAVIPQVLLAYREDSLSLKKILLARRNTCKMALRLAFQEKRFGLAAMVIAGQGVRSAMEILALPTGLNYIVLRSRAPHSTDEEAQNFHALWAVAQAAEPPRATVEIS
jgi:glycosyltransferase involved in cell wall biosynthesis